jgi:mannose-6-phosphate isomerase-like protein (cupin superfamily)
MTGELANPQPPAALTCRQPQQPQHDLPAQPQHDLPAQADVPRFEIVDFDNLPTVLCPCGTSQRGLTQAADYPLTIHRTEIHGEARLHYHLRLTECYYIISCESDAALELDGRRVPLHAGLCVLIRPGVRHRALGRMTVLNIVWPKFSDDDEWFD